MEMGDQSYRSDAAGNASSEGKFVTLTALPYPLPAGWADKFKEMGKICGTDKSRVHMSDFILVEKQCRAEIGVTLTRKFIEPVTATDNEAGHG